MDINKYNRVIIYQYGKCGSSSLKELFIKNGNKVIHTHSPNNIPPNTENVINTENVVNTGKDFVINITRNLFDRNISDYFQNITRQHHFWYFDTEEKIYNRKLGEILDNFNKKIISYAEQHLIKWYDKFFDKIGIDVFSERFNRIDKYMIYNNSKYTVLVLRYEDIKQWDNIFKKIFINKLPSIPQVNITQNKKINSIMTLFKKHYVIKYSYNIYIRNIKLMKHFYMTHEVNSYLSKYKQEPAPTPIEMSTLTPTSTFRHVFAPEQELISEQQKRYIKKNEFHIVPTNKKINISHPVIQSKIIYPLLPLQTKIYKYFYPHFNYNNTKNINNINNINNNNIKYNKYKFL